MSCKSLTDQLENQTAQLIDLNKEYKKQTAELEQTIKNVASLNTTLKTLAEEFHALSEVLKEHGTVTREKTKDQNRPVFYQCPTIFKKRKAKINASAKEMMHFEDLISKVQSHYQTNGAVRLIPDDAWEGYKLPEDIQKQLSKSKKTID